MTKDIPTPELLRKLLRYEPETGKLFWRERTPDVFASTSGRSAEHACANWNSRFSGREAFNTETGKGYLSGGIFNRRYLAHRVISALVSGVWPIDEIDHINGVRDDNRIENLRIVSHEENMRNSCIRRDNTSGVAGVSWDSSRGMWVAQIRGLGRNISLGRFVNIQEAIDKRKSAEVEFSYHKNHGRKA